MDGYTLARGVRELLQEPTNSTFLTDRTMYDYLFEGASLIADRTESLLGTQTITSVASQSSYTLNADFMRLYVTDSQRRFFIKYQPSTASTDSFVYHRDLSGIVFANTTSTVTIPRTFAIRDATQATNISGTATSTTSASNGEVVLNDTTKSFLTTVSVNDQIHNITDGSHGVVIAVSSNTAITCAMFEGSGNDFQSGDAYVIVPQGRFEIVFESAPTNSGDTITVDYVKRPAPVYSLYGKYNFSPSLRPAIEAYAAWKFKYRDREPSFGDAWYKLFESMCRRGAYNANRAFRKTQFAVNFNKRSYTDRSYR